MVHLGADASVVSSAMKHEVLTLRSVGKKIQFFETWYAATSASFLRGRVKNVSPDDDFEWRAYLDHRKNLKQAKGFK